MKKTTLFLLSLLSVPFAKASEIVHIKLSANRLQQLSKVSFEQLRELHMNGELKFDSNDNSIQISFEKTEPRESLITELRSKGIVSIHSSVMGSDTEGGCKN